MTKNMEDLLWRGDSLDRSSALSTLCYPAPATLLQGSRNCQSVPGTPERRETVGLYGQADHAGMSTLSTSLRSESAKYRKAARNINLELLLRKWAPVGGIGLFFIIFVWWRFF